VPVCNAWVLLFGSNRLTPFSQAWQGFTGDSSTFVLEQRIVLSVNIACIDLQSATERSVQVVQMKHVFVHTLYIST
jgi:hypothetical protein